MSNGSNREIKYTYLDPNRPGDLHRVTVTRRQTGAGVNTQKSVASSAKLRAFKQAEADKKNKELREKKRREREEKKRLKVLQA
jgi:hypothetical protein